MRAITITLLTIILLSCSKDDTPTPDQPKNNTTPLPTNINYLTDSFIQYNIVGTWNVYKETHTGMDTTYQYYLPTMEVINFTQTNYTTPYPLGTPQPYTYNSREITTTQHIYTVLDMSEEGDWMYMYKVNGTYLLGFDTLNISCTKQ
ncbi:MAG: hypothetical protein GY793_01515 [Proteobacteria bacterium]|nr:hypothetical protein [Pseudomonadota bacterium]